MISHDTFRLVLLIAFGLIVISLGSALYHLLIGGEHSQRTLKALTLRVSLSVVVILVLIFGQALGLIAPKPQSAPVGPQTQHDALPSTAPD